MRFRLALALIGMTGFGMNANAAILYNTPPASAGLSLYTTIITVNADNSITLSSGGGGAFGGEDSFIHVVNNSAATIPGFTLSGTDIFGFDGDGTLDGGKFIDPGDYSGPLVTFTYNTSNTDTGTVNFTGGLAPNSDTYFELEEDVNAAGSGFTVGPPGPTTTPEPASLALLGAGLVGLMAMRRRRP